MRTQSVEITIEPEEGAAIVVVADSHSAPHKDAADLIARLRPQAILHAGDVGLLTVLDELESIAPTHAVRGNIDGHDGGLPDELVLDIGTIGRRRLRILMVHIGLNGVRLRSPIRERARACHADLVVCGHSHIPLIGTDGGVTVLNPGSFGPRRFTLPTTVAMIDVGGDRIDLHHIDCTTGKRWTPPST